MPITFGLVHLIVSGHGELEFEKERPLSVGNYGAEKCPWPVT